MGDKEAKLTLIIRRRTSLLNDRRQTRQKPRIFTYTREIGQLTTCRAYAGESCVLLQCQTKSILSA